ncbi:putative LPS assembly protein LptD [Dawidia soli]|uniref:LPS-assembly protein LptD n=1 Tax=Dawidia soli TaxID=2782352 RepID=A0AAP2GH06_9BACT|nr:putative LPS assembly protein LptD [Dawidia soli]MBT1685508.1 LPS-assembly protein LptD [Dawidia soli]
MNFSLKAKNLTFNPVFVRHFSLLLFLLISTVAAAQVEPRVKTPQEVISTPNDSIPAPADSIPPPGALKDTLKSDTVKTPPPKGDIETTINYSAKDSIRATLDNQMVWLYGDAKIKYGEVELEAEEIIIDYANNTLTAHGRRDSLGQRVGYPIFKNGAELYETKDIVYNFKTRRARISEVVTTQGEGYVSSRAAFKNEKNEILSLHNSYTTCNLEHPHFRIISSKAKAIPHDKIVSGPFYFEFNEIPLPIGFLFGMFPSPRKSSSGIIFPSYGEERRRGFNLRNGGYFFDISEYVKLALTGDIYSKGGHAVYANSSYLKRYAYSGSVNFAYSRNSDTDEKIETNNYTQDFRLTWSHSPQSKGNGRFSASVNAATSTFNRNNFLSYGTPAAQYTAALSNISTKLSSNVSYSHRFAGTPFTMAINASHNQDIVTKNVDLALPTLTANMTNIYPFQKKSGETGPLDNFSISYAMTAQNRITNNLGRRTITSTQDSIAPFTLANFSRFFENGRKGIRHSIPMSYSFKAFKYFTMSPSVSFESKWYWEKLDYEYNSRGQLVVKDTIEGFNTIENYSVSTSLTTRMYGTYFFKKGKVKAIRHVVNPSISFGYTPDFTTNNGYFFKAHRVDSVYTDANDQLVMVAAANSEYYKSRHEGSVYGGSTTGRSGSIGFSLGNNVEMKVQGEQDSVARKVMLLNNLSLNTSYNLMADSFNLAPIGIAANTNILDNLFNLNASATLDPYSYQSFLVNPETNSRRTIERRVDRYVWRDGKLGRITSATLAVSTNLNPKARDKNNSSREKISKSDLPQQEKDYLIENPDAYVDFDIPWSLNLSYNAAYSHPVNSAERITQTVTANGDFALSKQWKFTYSTGYHFEDGEFSITQLGIARDLHCWTMSVNWTPFGQFQQFYFVINVKSSLLQDLKLERRKPFFDNL